GVLGLLDAAPGADVLFIGHHGMEGATKYTSIARGALVHARLRVRFWRVPASEIPKGQEARVARLFDGWGPVDGRGEEAGAGRVRFWRVPASEIPKGQEARVAWLFDCWERMDRWVAEVEAERG